jgi:hypothetical protein
MSYMGGLGSRGMDVGELVREHRARIVGGAVVAVAAVAIGIGLNWYFNVRWKPPPSIFDTPMNGVLDYFTTTDFNALPMRERMKYIEELVGRMRGMSQQDSVVAAAFLAGVTGKARAQLEQNVRILAKDILAEGAATYVNLPPEKRGEFLDQWLVEWVRTAELLATGAPSTRDPKEIVDSTAEQAKRNETNQGKRMAGRSLTPKGATRFLDFWAGEVEPAASPREMGQISKFMDGMRQHLLTK